MNLRENTKGHLEKRDGEQKSEDGEDRRNESGKEKWSGKG